MRLCLWLTMALALPLPAQDGPPARDANFYSFEKEVALGAQLSAQAAQRTKPLDSPAALDYVNQLGRRLAASFPGPAYTFTFALIAGNSGGATYEPISFPGGYIFVSAPLFLNVQDEGEFAAMLAHAIAHVAARHYRRQAMRGGLTNSQAIPVIFIGGWEGDATNPGANVPIPLALRDFRRQSELEADRLAAHALSETGFDPAALARYLSRVLPSDGRIQTKALSPLPAREERLASLAAAIQDLPARSYSPSIAFPPIQGEVRRRLPAPQPPPTLHR